MLTQLRALSNSVPFPSIVARLCTLFVAVPTRRAGCDVMRLFVFEILPAARHAGDSSNDQDDGQNSEYENVEHDSVHHSQEHMDTPVKSASMARNLEAFHGPTCSRSQCDQPKWPELERGLDRDHPSRAGI